MGIRMQANDFSLWSSDGTEKLFGVDSQGVPYFKGTFSGNINGTTTAGTSGYKVQIYVDDTSVSVWKRSGIRGYDSSRNELFNLGFAEWKSGSTLSPSLRLNDPNGGQTYIYPGKIVVESNLASGVIGVFELTMHDNKLIAQAPFSAWLTYSEVNNALYGKGTVYTDNDGYVKIRNW